jgi:hypothetical protein
VVAADARELLELARRADALMKGAIGIQGTPRPAQWKYHGRRHVFFALEEDIHRGSLQALALPHLPPHARGEDQLNLQRVELFPEALVRAARRKAGRGTEDD